MAWEWPELVVAALLPGMLVKASAEFVLEPAAFAVFVVGPGLQIVGAAVIAVVVAGGWPVVSGAEAVPEDLARDLERG